MLLPSLRLSDAQGSNSSEVSGFKEVLLSYTAHVQGCDDGVRQHIGEVLNPIQAAAASRESERERVKERERERSELGITTSCVLRLKVIIFI